MAARTFSAILLVSPMAYAQFGGGGFGGYGPPSTNGNDGDGGPFSGGGSSEGGFGRGGPFGDANAATIVATHAVLATLAFGLIFPVGGIIIRLFSFKGLWIAHALVQLLGLLLYTAAFGIGIYMAMNLELFNEAHVIIGIVLFALLAMQPFTGFIHHSIFNRIKRRSGWTYLHIWPGRVIVILGIVNGGLGLELAQRLPFARPSQGAIITYSVVAGVLGLAYILSIFTGESRRKRQIAAKRRRRSSSRNRSRSGTRTHEVRSTSSPRASEKRSTRYA